MQILQAVDSVFREVCKQRGPKRSVADYREYLLINRCITQDSRQSKQSLSIAWIHYRKAFDITSHHLVVYYFRSQLPCGKLRDTLAVYQYTGST